MCLVEAMLRDLVSGCESAEYESEDEERVRWLFIGIMEVGAVEVWSCS